MIVHVRFIDPLLPCDARLKQIPKLPKHLADLRFCPSCSPGRSPPFHSESRCPARAATISHRLFGSPPRLSRIIVANRFGMRPGAAVEERHVLLHQFGVILAAFPAGW